MALHPLAGQPAPVSMLEDIPRLVAAYYALHPDPTEPAQRVRFGTSGHRGSSLDRSFNEDHIVATVQAICDWRTAHGVSGPLFLGVDTHALSEPARITTIEVCAANGVALHVDEADGPTPTPVISHAILTHPGSDGIVITPSHNPPRDGGIKYNPPHGGPAEAEITGWIEDRANALLAAGLAGAHRTPYERARPLRHDYITPYVRDLGDVIDMEALRGLRLGVDPLGGAGVHYWGPIAETWGLDITVVDPQVDPTFRFMTLDHDGRIRMDCSSPWAMARLIALKDRFDLAFGNDPDYDRHGIVTPTGGLLPPNHYLAVAIDYLFTHRPAWGDAPGVGKTLVSSGMIDRVAGALGRRLVEVPVGFKWFVPGLGDGSLGFGGEESAGASFLRKDGRTWTTDKDGILLDLLAAELVAVTGQDPAQRYAALVARHGDPVYARIDAPATPAQKARLARLSPDDVHADTLAGQPITARLTHAAGNGAAIGGLKVTTRDGWFAARPSGTEQIYKIYAESFLGADHLRRIQDEARALISSIVG